MKQVPDLSAFQIGRTDQRVAQSGLLGDPAGALASPAGTATSGLGGATAAVVEPIQALCRAAPLPGGDRLRPLAHRQ